MKQILGIVLIALVSIAMTPVSRAADDARITEMIKELARLTALAEACGGEMNNWGKKAVDGEACKAFTTRFYAAWPDRETLMAEVADYFDRVESGAMECDSGCRDRLQRVEELRVTVTYYLDYMDFVQEF